MSSNDLSNDLDNLSESALRSLTISISKEYGLEGNIEKYLIAEKGKIIFILSF